MCTDLQKFASRIAQFTFIANSLRVELKLSDIMTIVHSQIKMGKLQYLQIILLILSLKDKLQVLIRSASMRQL